MAGGDGAVGGRAEMFRYHSPLFQVILLGLICFCCPGMFNALNGLGAGGKRDATTTDNANTALAVTFAVFSLVAPGLFNVLGHRVTLFLGGLTYVLYVGSYLSYAPAFVVLAGAVLGVGAGFLWTAQGAMMMSYPGEGDKGKFIGVFWGIFNLGACLGSLVPLAIEFHNRKPEVSTATYGSFMGVMAVGAALAWTLAPPARVVRRDGSRVASHRFPAHWRGEAAAVARLFLDWRMLALAPMFAVSNWFYTYQFNAVNGGGRFTVRARAFNGTFYWAAQIAGANAMGAIMDARGAPRRRRARAGLLGLAALVAAVWAGGLAFQLTFTRESAAATAAVADAKAGTAAAAAPHAEALDLARPREFAGPFALFACYGLFDAVWQTYAYWLMGALTNETRQAARFAGFYKAVQNAGSAVAAQVDARKASYLAQLGVNWGLLALGVVCAVPVAWSVQDTLLHDGDAGGGSYAYGGGGSGDEEQGKGEDAAGAVSQGDVAGAVHQGDAAGAGKADAGVSVVSAAGAGGDAPHEQQETELLQERQQPSPLGST